MILADIVTFLGRFHPLIVHLPIGFLLMATFFNVLSYFPKYRFFQNAVSLTLLAGFLCALVACILGYMLSLSGEYDRQILNSHKWSGVLLTIFSALLWSMTTNIWVRFVTIHRSIVTALCFVLVCGVTCTGHLGGTLTHGSGYLSLETLNHHERPKPDKAEEALIFEDVVQPMLERRCEGCHHKGKRKGQLTVSTYAQLMKGGKHGPVLVAGKPEQSELYRRITLDPAHEDFMPTDGKTPLTKLETEMIRWWIDKAGAMEGRKLVDVNDHEKMVPVVASLLKLPGSLPLEETDMGSMRQVNAAIPAAANMAAVGILRQKGMNVRVMLHTPAMLDVTVPPGSNLDMDEIVNALDSVAESVIWLNVSDNKLTEQDLSILKRMKNLEKLRLEKNPIGDGIVDLLLELKFLEAVNLNETLLTKNGLMRLRSHPNLKRIYTWNAAVTRAE